MQSSDLNEYPLALVLNACLYQEGADQVVYYK